MGCFQARGKVVPVFFMFVYFAKRKGIVKIA